MNISIFPYCFLKGSKFVVKRKKKSRVNIVKNIISTSTSVDFGIDLDTPPHQFALLKSIEESGHQLEKPIKTVSHAIESTGKNILST